MRREAVWVIEPHEARNLDIVAVSLANGQRLQALPVADVYTPEWPAIHSDTSLRGDDVVAVRNQHLKKREALQKF